jgi:hypothetical protein
MADMVLARAWGRTAPGQPPRRFTLTFVDSYTPRYRLLDEQGGEPASIVVLAIRFVEHREAGERDLLRLDTIETSQLATGSRLELRDGGKSAGIKLYLRSFLHILGTDNSAPAIYFDLELDAKQQRGHDRSIHVVRLTVGLNGGGATYQFNDNDLHMLAQTVQPAEHGIGGSLAGAAPLAGWLLSGDRVAHWGDGLYFTVVAADQDFNGPFNIAFARRLWSASGDKQLTLRLLDGSAGRAPALSVTTLVTQLDDDLIVYQIQAPGWARLTWDDVAGPVPWLIALDGFKTSEIVATLNEQVAARYYGYEETFRGDRPMSLLPRLEPDTPSQRWTALLRLLDQAPHLQGTVAATDLSAPETVRLGFGRLRELLRVGPTSPPPLGVTARFERLRDRDGAPLTRRLILRQQQVALDGALPAALSIGAQRPIVLDAERQRLALLDFEIVVPEASLQRQVLRIGAFDLDFPKDQRAAGQPDRPGQLLQLWMDPHPGTPPRWSPYLHISLALDVADFGPGSQDLPELASVTQDDRAQPVLIDLATAAAPSGPLALELEERAFPDGERQAVDLRLTAPGPGKVPGRNVVVLDGEPFLVARVGFPELAGTDESSLIAEWQSDSVDGARWQIRAAPSGYELLLPPQAIGEAAVKQLPETSPPDIASGTTADFRLGPPARLQLLTSWRGADRALVEPPTNTRRIFGDASQRAPGAPLQGAGFELLYGMSATIAGRDDLLVTELTADLGLPPPPLDQWPRWDKGSCDEALLKARFPAFRQLWDDTLARFGARLGALTLHPVGGREAQPIDDGVQFALRPSAEIRRPVALGPGPSRHSPYDDAGRRIGIAQPPADLLPGGADWGFESTEIYESVWRNARSDAGMLAGVAFSALGGWGYQKAIFDNRRTSILSRAALGRTHFYSLERVGRIGVFWNRAKHVIIYERSTLPSDQFGPQQTPHLGRPILRKVREYVEILEPERRFPEDGRAKVDRGPVLALRFRSTIIPVDSAWGHDLPGQGWVVPLWQPGKDPAVYPRPLADLELAAHPDSGVPSVRQILAAPQQLQFFTSTLPRDDDRTDLWAPVPAVDFVDLPVPVPPPAPSLAESDPDGPLPSAQPVEAGYADFTFALEPLAEHGANLVAERVVGNAVGAVLRNVTMMRAAPVAIDGELAAQARQALAMANSVGAAADLLRQRILALRASTVTGPLADRIRQEIARLAADPDIQRIQTFLDQPGGLKEIIDAHDPCEALARRVGDGLAAAVARLEEELDDRLAKLSRDLAAAVGSASDLESGKARLRELVHAWFGLLYSGLGQAGNVLEDAAGALDRLKDLDLAAIVDRGLDRLRQEVRAQADRGVERVLGALDRTKAAILAELDGAIDSVLRDLARQWPKAAMALAKPAADARKAAAQAIAEAIESARQASSGEIDTVLAAAIGTLKGKLAAALATLGGAVDSQLLEPLRTPLAEIDAARAAIVAEARSAEDAAEAIIAAAPDLPALASRLQDHLAATVRQAIDGIRQPYAGKVQTALSALCSQFLGGKEFLGQEILGALQTSALIERLKAVVSSGAPMAQLLDELDGVLRDYAGTAQLFAERLVGDIRAKLGTLAQAGSPVLGLLRALGDAPRVPGLDFNRAAVAYYFNPRLLNVLVTPMAALVDRVGQELKGLGIRLPTTELADRLVPSIDLPQLDLGTLFPDFAGIRLDRLLPDLKVPPSARDKVAVRHGFDKETRRGWVEARVDGLAVGDRAALFDLGPVSVGLRGGVFTAETRLAIGTDGRSERHARGRIDGSWDLGFGGQTLVTFRDTPLTFDDAGGLRFDIRPERVELASALSFLDAFVKSLGDEAGGLRLSTIKDGNLPVGVEALLDLPIPPLTYGTFGISGLRLTTGLQLRAWPDFEIRAFLGLGSETEPFTITVFILGGAGWVNGAARYLPSRNQLQVDLSIAIGASAAIGFNFGPVRGGVQLFFGLDAELHTAQRGGARLDLVIVLMASGCVRVANLISVGLHLILEVRIEEGKRVVGHGTVSYSIKLGFIKKTFSASVTYRFAGSGPTAKAAPALHALAGETFLELAQDYLATLA